MEISKKIDEFGERLKEKTSKIPWEYLVFWGVFWTSWLFCVISGGFILGLGLGWLPSGILAFIVSQSLHIFKAIFLTILWLLWVLLWIYVLIHVREIISYLHY